VIKSLQANGFRACEVRDAPDRPSGELVFSLGLSDDNTYVWKLG
jgi:hypothetical protein